MLDEDIAVGAAEDVSAEIEVEDFAEPPKQKPQPDGVQRHDDDMGGITEITYKGGQKNGSMKILQDGRLTVEMTFLNDVLDGFMYTYFPNGAIQMKMLFANDKSNGEALNYHPNGVVSMTSMYVDGKKQGLCQAMDDEGSLIQDSYYKDDILHGAVTTYHEGEIIARSFYDNGVEIKGEPEDEVEQTSIWG